MYFRILFTVAAILNACGCDDRPMALIDSSVASSTVSEKLTRTRIDSVQIRKVPADVDLTSYRVGIVGRREYVSFPPLDATYQARIDSGANTSSLDARNIEAFERNGEPWVRFELHGRSDQQPQRLERRVTREVTIKTHSDVTDSRYAVKMNVMLGDTTIEREFTLVDRDGFDFSVLIGRNVLDSIALIDVSRVNVLPAPEADPLSKPFSTN